jgi:hypothetical protein
MLMEMPFCMLVLFIPHRRAKQTSDETRSLLEPENVEICESLIASGADLSIQGRFVRSFHLSFFEFYSDISPFKDSQ